MAHHLRKERNCLNCGAIVPERFCTRCGQENIPTKDSFGHVIRHFFEDFTHYDSKFFVTIKDLLFKPGFLTRQYLSGKRQSYLHPIRMYLFISFVYFLVAFSTGNFGATVERGMIAKGSFDDRKIIADSIAVMIAEAKRDTIYGEIKEPLLQRINDIVHFPSDSSLEQFNMNLFFGFDYRALRQYDSIQQSLPVEQRETGIKPWAYRRWLHSIEHYGKGSVSLLVQKMRFAIPKMMFILLPLCALLLKLFYSKKKYVYADHAIFTLHVHCAIFLLFLFTTIVSLTIPPIRTYLSLGELVLLTVYCYMALRFVYQQSWWLTLLKLLTIGILYLVFLMTGGLVISLAALL